MKKWIASLMISIIFNIPLLGSNQDYCHTTLETIHHTEGELGSLTLSNHSSWYFSLSKTPSTSRNPWNKGDSIRLLRDIREKYQAHEMSALNENFPSNLLKITLNEKGSKDLPIILWMSPDSRLILLSDATEWVVDWIYTFNTVHWNLGEYVFSSYEPLDGSFYLYNIDREMPMIHAIPARPTLQGV